MADPRTELADIIAPVAPAAVATGSNLAGWGAAVLAALACIALAAWLWHRSRHARALRRLVAAVARRQDSVPALAAQLDAWARAHTGLARIESALCPPGWDPAVWADWATMLGQLRFAPSPPDGYAALALLCKNACGWKRHG
ncbi:MAG: hypothetical protein Q7J36_03550 [Thiobacillus sp.]|nr:hypothetical protein [Thiobacillus sp.]